jgi:hypothetical protein
MAVYNALTRGIEYVEAGAVKYREQFIQRELKILHKPAAKYNCNLVEYKCVT